MSELDALKRHQRAAATAALKVMAEDLAGHAQRLAPIEEGTLRASADVEIVEEAHGVRAVVSFPLPYAQVQHEDLTLEHPHGGQAKYLEQPLKAMAPRYERALVAAIGRVS